MSNFNLNFVILAGRLTADPELKQTTSGVPVTTFQVAINRHFQNGGQQVTDFLSVVAWRKTAEFVSRYFRKGSAICIRGSAQTRSWTDQNGSKHTVTEFVADEAMFVDGKQEAEASSPSYSAPTGFSAPSAQTPSPAPKFEALDDSSDLPF